MAALIAGGIARQARLDPILPGISDTPGGLRDLFFTLAQAGVGHAAAGTLFLRPGIVGSLKRNIRDENLLRKTLGSFHDAGRMAIRAGDSTATVLPRVARAEIFSRVRVAAEQHSIRMSVCACKNPDIAHGTCGIGDAWSTRLEVEKQPTLPAWRH